MKCSFLIGTQAIIIQEYCDYGSLKYNLPRIGRRGRRKVVYEIVLGMVHVVNCRVRMVNSFVPGLFLHSTFLNGILYFLQIVHRNLSMHSIFLTSGNQFKIGGFMYATYMTDENVCFFFNFF